MAEDNFKSDVADVRFSLQRFTYVDYAVFIMMLTICGLIGIYFGFVNKQKSTQDYLMGGRNMKLVPVCFSLVASFISGISLLGTPTELYLFGTAYVFSLFGAVAMSLTLGSTFLPVFHELQITSVYEYLELRYDKRVRIFGSAIFSIYLMAWLPIVIYVPALAFNQVTGFNIHIISPIICSVCIFYTSLGGLKAVVWTDVLQTIVMVSAMILVIFKSTIIVGGINEVLRRNWSTDRLAFPSLTFDLTERHSIWSVSIGATFYWIGNIAVNQSMMQRFLALSELKSAKRAIWGFLFGVFVIVFICGYSGLVAYAKYYECDPLDSKLALAKDQLLPLLVMDVFADWEGMPGIFIAGVFSAALSSLSTGLNSMAAVVLEDFWKPFCKVPTPKQSQIIVRLVVIILGCICFGLVFVVEKLGSVLQLTMSLSSASMGPLAGVFLMGLFFPFIDSTDALCGGIIGLLSAWWVTAQSQFAIAKGLMKYNEKIRFTNNCSYTFKSAVIHATESSSSEVPALYRISYLWFTALGCIVTVTISCLVSLRTSNKVKRDIRTFAPAIRKYLNKREQNDFSMDEKSRFNIIPEAFN
ncbi:sodium-coupled monocarboxylate transporter 1-like isoform X1 [Bombyx mandarina]|uniref:Sodium-coupled monocarboxylate transporter 1-like isoform X1 n=1 Tax=Bombyx mandarina TaxID=7092 RepID=A0A6J2JEM6_BOMMA|nr:sodium-coupled monocarboxylate transporter 1-like isoform X1 [Bombyx mandarina]